MCVIYLIALDEPPVVVDVILDLCANLRVPRKDLVDGRVLCGHLGLCLLDHSLEFLKARFAAAKTGLPALSDDSGIEITALNGAPGIYSARYAGIENDFQANIEKVLSELGKLGPDAPRHARFVSVMVLMRWENDPCPLIAEGYWEGMITETPSGTKGFGYDPIFYDPTHQMTAAEMTPDLKNQISHRAKAIAQLLRLAQT